MNVCLKVYFPVSIFCLISFPFPICTVQCLPSKKDGAIWISLYFCESGYGFLERKGIFYAAGAPKPFACDAISLRPENNRKFTV
jgi:hypothetical protein